MSHHGIDKDSNVFHLSLTEIAFLIILALVLLLGFPLRENLLKNENLEQEIEDLKICKLLPDDPKVDPDRPESHLYPCDRCVANNYNIPLEEARQLREIGRAASIYLKDEKDISPQKIQEFAEHLKKSKSLVQEINDLKEKNAKFLDVVQENKRLKKYAEENEILKKEKDNLLSQNKSLLGNNIKLIQEKEKLENKIYYGGDFPPCMQGQTRNSRGQISKWDSLFRIHMKENRVYVSFAYEKAPNHPALDNDIQTLAKRIVEASSEGNGLSWSSFDNIVEPIFIWSEKHDPRCRLAVLLENRIQGRQEADEKRTRYIESRFYKQEILEKRQ